MSNIGEKKTKAARQFLHLTAMRREESFKNATGYPMKRDIP